MPRTDPTHAAEPVDWFADQFAAAAPALLAWARLRLTGAQLDPEDLLQEVGCRAFAARGSYEAARGTFRQWLFGFATRVLLEVMRDRQRHPADQPLAFGSASGSQQIAATITTITRQLARGELVQRFLARLDELTDDDRGLMIYHGLEGLPHAHVATLLGIGETALRKRWQRLCERLRHDPVFVSLLAG